MLILLYLMFYHLKILPFLNSTKKNPGFTLVELLITIAIIGILVAIAIPQYNQYIKKVKTAVAKQDIRQIEKQINIYKSENNSLPDNLNQLLGDGMIHDPWGNTYEYYTIDSVNIGQMRKDRSMVPVNTDYDLYSKGPDGVSKKPFTAKHSQDDIVRANDGDFVGRVANY